MPRHGEWVLSPTGAKRLRSTNGSGLIYRPAGSISTPEGICPQCCGLNCLCPAIADPTPINFWDVLPSGIVVCGACCVPPIGAAEACVVTPLFTAAQLNVLWRIATTQSAPGSYCDFQFEIDTGLLTSFRFVQQNVGQNCNGAPTASFNRPVLLTGVFDAGVASVTIASSIERVGNWSAIYFQGTVFPPAGGEWPSCSVSIPNEAAQCCDRIDRQTRSGRSGSVFVAGTP